MLLEVKNLSVFYGMARALHDVSFAVGEGEIVAMVGPNGAGKSTALKAVCGVLAANGGRIETGEVSFAGEDIRKLRTDQLVAKGLSLIPEGRRVFPTLTVRENLEMGAFTMRYKTSVVERIEEVFAVFPRLKERAKQSAGTLSSGEQQMLAMGRALMLKPRLLLADEPSLGLSPNFVELIFDKLVEINKSGTSVLLVEQNARMALEVCQRAYVFEVGAIALDGSKEQLMNDDKVRKVFLGG